MKKDVLEPKTFPYLDNTIPTAYFTPEVRKVRKYDAGLPP